jgi:hypothetical protein
MNNLMISEKLLRPLGDHVRAHGGADAEAGGFLLGGREIPLATVLALAEGPGVERSRGIFRVSGAAIDQLFAWAEERELRVWAQVHSHPRGSFLSDIDEREGFRVEGFISAVIPDYGDPPEAPSAWGFWRFVGGAWSAIEPAHTTGAAGSVYTFSEDGVR